MRVLLGKGGDPDGDRPAAAVRRGDPPAARTSPHPRGGAGGPPARPPPPPPPRLCGQARAGEILASREVTHLARRLEGVRYEDRGSLTFKGIADPVAVVRGGPQGG